MMMTEPLGVYVHIPFCLSKCRYCDFCSYPSLSSEERWAYLCALRRELESKAGEQRQVTSLFFGGGTPSLLTPKEFEFVMEGLQKTFHFADNMEFTMEANPKTLTKEKLKCYQNGGMNRLSIGLQSAVDKELSCLGRAHGYGDFLSTYRLARECMVRRINVDIMYAIPHQTRESLAYTLEQVLSLRPEHISAYSLILEEGTPFYDCRKDLPLPGEEVEADMTQALCQALGAAGYVHYEISNFALPGEECRHNLLYWRCGSYLGFGAAAHSFDHGVRQGHVPQLDAYIRDPFLPAAPPLTPAQLAYEYAMLRLRLAEGLSLSDYRARFGVDFTEHKEDDLRTLAAAGLIIRDGDRLALSERGFFLCNTILTMLL